MFKFIEIAEVKSCMYAHASEMDNIGRIIVFWLYVATSCFNATVQYST